MVVSIDKATALRMHDKVKGHWAAATARVQKELGELRNGIVGRPSPKMKRVIKDMEDKLDRQWEWFKSFDRRVYLLHIQMAARVDPAMLADSTRLATAAPGSDARRNAAPRSPARASATNHRTHAMRSQQWQHEQRHPKPATEGSGKRGKLVVHGRPLLPPIHRHNAGAAEA
mgnify:CR=1 FL=1